MKQPRYWVGVAFKDHVLKGVEGGFCQLCHGKSNPLKRLNPGDWIIYYSPRAAQNDGEQVQAFTAIGQVLAGEPYRLNMEDEFAFDRRDVQFVAAQETPIRSLLNNLSFIKNKQSWGYVFRFGLLEIPEPDFQTVAAAMKAEVSIHPMKIDWTEISRFAAPEKSAGYLLWQVTHAWQRQVDEALSELGITHLQFVLLAGIGWLTRSGDLLTQVQLAEFCSIDVMQISQVVRKLETKALVKRSGHPTDTRAKVLTLTLAGEAILKQAVPQIEQLDAAFFGRCDQASLLTQLIKLQDEV
jgi:DNA-binding MarR family transcriptional regulator